MAKGLVGGVNTTVKSFTASTGEDSTYTARVTSVDSSPVEYSGVETDSLKIHVDNVNRTISGDVVWRDMIASSEAQQDANHAYPAHLAKMKFDAIGNALEDLNTTVGNLSNLCASSNLKVDTYTDTIDDLQKLITDVQKSCDNLSTALSLETSKRETEHAIIKGTIIPSSINDLRTDVNDKLSNFEDSINTNIQNTANLESAIKNEVNRAKDDEKKLKSSIQSVENSVKNNSSAISDLYGKVQNTVGRIDTLETSDVSSQTSDNTRRIEQLEKQITVTKSTLTSKLDKLEKIDGEIKSVQDKHSGELSRINADVAQVTSDVSDLKSKTTKTEQELHVLSNAHSNLVETNTSAHTSIYAQLNAETATRQQLYEYHESELDRLEVRISNLQSRITKLLEDLANELRSKDAELENNLSNISYDFIDAGTAPI